MAQIRVGIVDDQRCFVQMLQAYLRYETTDIEVVGVAYSAVGAVQIASETKPDVVVMDLALPDESGLDAALSIRKNLPHTKILVLTSEQSPGAMAGALKSGIHGYITKSEDIETVINGIFAVHAGEFVFDERAREAVVKWAQQPAKLSDTETQVMRLVAAGKRNHEIAVSLAMSLPTVKRHLQRAGDKLGARNRVAAAIEATRRNLI